MMIEKVIVVNDDDMVEIVVFLSSYGLFEGRVVRDMFWGFGGWRLRGNV